MGPPRPVAGKLDRRAFLWTGAGAALALWLVLAVLAGLPLSLSFLLSGAAGTTLALGLWWRRLRDGTPHVFSLDEDGLFVMDGTTARLVPYGDMEQLVCLTPSRRLKARTVTAQPTWPLMAVVLNTGQQLAVPDDMVNRDELQRLLALTTFSRRYHRHATTLNQQEQVTLGQITLTPEGIHPWGQQALPWEQLHALNATVSHLRWRPMTGFTHPILCNVEKVTDIDVLFSLAMSLATRKRRLA